MGTYHLRRSEKQIRSHAELLEIIRGHRFVTLAMCKDNEPYLVTVNYGFDEAEDCFYFHCAAQGKKIDYLRANPIVWGQVLEDRGYLAGECDHAFRTVQFRGRAEFVADPQERLRALRLLVDQLEPDPEAVWRRMQQHTAGFQGVCVVRVRVLEMTGKQGPAQKS